MARAVDGAGRIGRLIGAQHRAGSLGAIFDLCLFVRCVDNALVRIVSVVGGEVVDVLGLVKFEVVSAPGSCAYPCPLEKLRGSIHLAKACNLPTVTFLHGPKL